MNFLKSSAYPITKIAELDEIIRNFSQKRLCAIIGSHAKQLAYDVMVQHKKVHFINDLYPIEVQPNALNIVDHKIIKNDEVEVRDLLRYSRNNDIHILMVCQDKLITQILHWHCDIILKASESNVTVVKNRYAQDQLSITYDY